MRSIAHNSQSSETEEEEHCQDDPDPPGSMSVRRVGVDATNAFACFRDSHVPFLRIRGIYRLDPTQECERKFRYTLKAINIRSHLLRLQASMAQLFQLQPRDSFHSSFTCLPCRNLPKRLRAVAQTPRMVALVEPI